MRWKYVVPALVILIVLALFDIFFLDTLIRWGLIAGGQFAFGAKVEVTSVKTHLANLSIVINYYSLYYGKPKACTIFSSSYIRL